MAFKAYSIWSEMIDEIFKNIHLFGCDIVERYGKITATIETLFLLIELIFPIPTVLGNMTRYQMMFWNKGKESLPPLLISGVSSQDSQVMQAFANLNILSSLMTLATHLLVIYTQLNKVYQTQRNKKKYLTSTNLFTASLDRTYPAPPLMYPCFT